MLERRLTIAEMASTLGVHASTVSHWLKQHDLRPENRARYAPKGGLPEAALREAVGQGRTLASIAEEFAVSISSVRYWLGKHGIERGAVSGPRSPLAAEGRARGLPTIRMVCREHGTTEFVLENRGYYRCKRCRAAAVIKRRRRVKTILVEEAGGACALCGYDRFSGALHFHHVEPREKSFALSRGGITRAIDELRAEARKCILLCSNCHAEVEGGVVAVPAPTLWR